MDTGASQRPLIKFIQPGTGHSASNVATTFQSRADNIFAPLETLGMTTGLVKRESSIPGFIQQFLTNWYRWRVVRETKEEKGNGPSTSNDGMGSELRKARAAIRLLRTPHP